MRIYAVTFIYADLKQPRIASVTPNAECIPNSPSCTHNEDEDSSKLFCVNDTSLYEAVHAAIPTVAVRVLSNQVFRVWGYRRSQLSGGFRDLKSLY
jgi:hypothetical protein